jgi:hypothetical protein
MTFLVVEANLAVPQHRYTRYQPQFICLHGSIENIAMQHKTQPQQRGLADNLLIPKEKGRRNPAA